MHARGHEGSQSKLRWRRRTDLWQPLFPVWLEAGAYGDQPKIDPPSSSAGGRAAGAGAEPLGLRPSRRTREKQEDEPRRWMSRRGPQVRGGTPALTVTQCPRDEARMAYRA